MLMGGIAVDNLKADIKTLLKLKGISIPRSVRRAVVNALAQSSWFALLGVFRCDQPNSFFLFFRSVLFLRVAFAAVCLAILMLSSWCHINSIIMFYHCSGGGGLFRG